MSEWQLRHLLGEAYISYCGRQMSSLDEGTTAVSQLHCQFLIFLPTPMVYCYIFSPFSCFMSWLNITSKKFL